LDYRREKISIRERAFKEVGDGKSVKKARQADALFGGRSRYAERIAPEVHSFLWLKGHKRGKDEREDRERDAFDLAQA
jgi:hypothetical protein